MKSLFAFASAAVVLTACGNNEEGFVNSNFPQDSVIRVVTNIGNPETRTGITTDNIEYFNLNIENKSDAKYSYYAAIIGPKTRGWKSYVADGGSTPLTMLWKNSTTPVIVTAFSQLGLTLEQTDFNSSATLLVGTDQTGDNAIKQSDVLYMKAKEVNPATDLVDGKLNISLAHLFSKINLTVTLGTEFNTAPGTDTNPITGVKVNGAIVRIPFTASTGQFGTPDSQYLRPITPWYDADAYTAGSGDTQNAVAKYEAILPPQTIQSGGFSISFTIGDRAYKWTSAKDVTFDSGKAYTLALAAGKDILTVKSLSATTWDEQTEGSIETE